MNSNKYNILSLQYYITNSDFTSSKSCMSKSHFWSSIRGDGVPSEAPWHCGLRGNGFSFFCIPSGDFQGIINVWLIFRAALAKVSLQNILNNIFFLGKTFLQVFCGKNKQFIYSIFSLNSFFFLINHILFLTHQLNFSQWWLFKPWFCLNTPSVSNVVPQFDADKDFHDSCASGFYLRVFSYSNSV